ncbi:MAG: GNAT family N-acetyltransferase [Bacteroidales bacterium]
MNTLLENKRIRLRAMEPEDLEVLYLWENDPRHWKVSQTLIPFSKFTLKQFIKQSTNDLYTTRQFRLMIIRKNDNHPLGAIDLFDFDPYHKRGGVGILIHNENHRNKGYASEALQLFKEYCFGHLKLHQLYCHIATDNQASLRLFTGNGFTVIGEKKEWLFNGNGFSGEWMLQCINPSS